jgi:hypothetical protein
MGESMAEGQHCLAETETAVPIICQPSEGKMVGVLGGRTTFKVLSAQTGGAYAIAEQQMPAGRNVGPDEGRLLLSFIQGRFANYFIEADGLPDNDRAAITALFAEYDVEILERGRARTSRCT